MKTFQELNFKEHYDSQKDNLLKDFYIPALANSKNIVVLLDISIRKASHLLPLV